MVFRISIALLVVLVVLGVLLPETFYDVSAAALAGVIAYGGWLFLLIVALIVAFLLYLAFARYGALRIGGEDAEPEFSSATWLAMLFAAGMGIGLVFWGAAEPVSHLAAPPEALAPGSIDAARASMRYVFFHWGLHPWAIYALVGLAIAWFRYNLGKNGQISELLQPLIGRFASGWLAAAIDIIAVLATAVGVATTLGFGAAQISAGLSRSFGLPQGFGLQLTVIAIAFVLYMASSVSGLHRGIKWLSSTNLVIATLLALAVFVIGPTRFILDTFTTTLGGYINSLPDMSLRMAPYSGASWVGDWTVFFWAWWIAWAPFVGAFIARVSYGRTVREFVVGVVLLPSLVGFMWFAVFGGAALHAEIFEGTDLGAALAQGHEQVLFALFESMPASQLLAGAAIVLLMVFFVTSADSATMILASMSSAGDPDPPLKRRVTWGVVQALIAVALLRAGSDAAGADGEAAKSGLDALQAMVTVVALPFVILLAAVAFSLYKVMSDEELHQERRARNFRHAIERWLAREEADVERLREAAATPADDAPPLDEGDAPRRG
ncbi:BCCT family transporter [Coralloluteibacterium stylophorae]|uniref:BCCT family transporter n=2 Tax=Coralloluteibacterium stylophorae TaxID=1776034 RepID=A0AAP2CA72_9GAMM|nr:BCCT family transporter [Coralloluteibacterium stylophorae]MBS7456489.1 BCCT family transporter [Coralloluteibacterium stylophorae]